MRDQTETRVGIEYADRIYRTQQTAYFTAVEASKEVGTWFLVAHRCCAGTMCSPG